MLRHLAVGGLSAVVVVAGWQITTGWDPEMQWWKSFGVSAAFLIWFVALIGPAVKLWKPLTRILSWRREFGIWFAVLSLVHFYLIWDGWARWDPLVLLGYQYVPELDMYLRFEPGFGLANMQGLLALLLALVLAATSFDRAVKFLGPSSWRWLHSFTNVIFYTVALHSLYFAFIHFTPSPHRLLMGLPTEYPENTLRFVYLAMLLSVFFAQVAAFVKTVRLKKRVGRDKVSEALESALGEELKD